MNLRPYAKTSSVEDVRRTTLNDHPAALFDRDPRFPQPSLRHSIGFFRRLCADGRADLAGLNAAIDGRLRLARMFYRRAGLSTDDSRRRAFSDWRNGEPY